jgi:hypothetical protein
MMNDIRNDPREIRARRERALVGGAGLLLCAGLIALACGVVPPAQNPATDGNLAAQTACVYEAGAGLADASAKKAAIDECRCAAKAQYGSPCDGGSPQ